MSPDVELNPRTNNLDINAILAKHPRSDDIITNLDVAKEIIKANYRDSSRLDLVILYLKKHFKLNTDSVAILKMYWTELYKEHKVTLQATGTPKESRKETSEATGSSIDSRKESLGAIDTPKETRKETKEREAKEAKEERERAHNEEFKEKQERKTKAEEWYKIFDNEDGTHTLREIRETKEQIRKLLMRDFWSIQGRNPKTNNPGYVVLQKLEISDYLNKTFRLVRVGGQIWRYDWRKGYYIYDAGNDLLKKEIGYIMTKVGNRDEGYEYNGNSIADSADIIDMASFGSKVFIDTNSPFNKQIALNENIILINAKNGVLQIDYKNKKVKLLGKKPEYLFSYCINAKYNPEIANDVIHEMLIEILGEEDTELIYQIAAMAIRDTNPKLIPSKIAYLFIGPRNTGKNTVMDVLHRFFGNAIVSRITLNDIAKNKYIKTLMEGKVINLDDELPEQLQFTESREIKSLTGEKSHYIEPKYGKPYIGTITALMVFAGNQFPRCSISKNDSAFWARWEVIHFTHPEFKVDENHNKRLLTPANLSGFFNRVIQKLFEIRENGIKRRNNALTVYDEWQGSSNNVYRFWLFTTSCG
jgi:Family of unknown function (DUF5906)